MLTSLFLFNEEFSLSSTQYKKTFAFLWQGKAFPSITNIYKTLTKEGKSAVSVPCSGKMYNMTDNTIMDVFNHIVFAWVFFGNVLEKFVRHLRSRCFGM